MSDDANWLDQAVNVLKRLKEGWGLFAWFRKRFNPQKPVAETATPTESTPGILIIGPGGTGKTTLAKLLSGQLDAWVFGDAWKYEESYGEESYQLLGDPTVEIVVPAGQEYRRAASWADVRADVTGGRYAGVIIVTAFGCHTLGGLGYKSHPLYAGNKERFLEAFRVAKQEDERKVLDFLTPALEDAPGKLWLLTVVVKQDLWWERRSEAEAAYLGGVWADALREVEGKRGGKTFRHETAFVTLVSANLEDPEGEVLFRMAAGYDMSKRADSVNALLGKLGALKDWEAAT